MTQAAETRSIDRLRLTNFRCYESATLSAAPGAVVITGDNGAGKTNLLEAISLLSPGRGLRFAALPEMAREGGDGSFAVAARLQCSEGEAVEIGTGALAASPGRRQVRINGASASAASLSEWLSVLWLTPAMDRLLVDSAGARRRFLDRLTLALQSGHAHDVGRYEAAMRSRNRLLADDGPRDADWLSALEKQMAQHGARIAGARAETVKALDEIIADAPASPFPKAGLSIEGEDWRDEDALRAALSRGRSVDAAAGRTTTGPHRIDLGVVHIAKQQPAARASTGEQKALLLGLVLAHARIVAARTGRRPVLLLDEVAAHLDETRRAALFAMIEEMGTQVWMTGTDVSLFRAIGDAATYIEVSSGRLCVK